MMIYSRLKMFSASDIQLPFTFTDLSEQGYELTFSLLSHGRNQTRRSNILRAADDGSLRLVDFRYSQLIRSPPPS